MIKLEKNKVYKITTSHPFVLKTYPRNYIIVCPSINISFYGRKSFHAHFIVSYDGIIRTNCESGIESGYDTLSVLTQNDLKEVKKAIGILKFKCLYNRKLNELIYEAESEIHI